MARRRSSQEALVLPGSGPAGHGSSLGQLAVLINCAPVEARLDDVSASTEGEPAWPPLALFRALLIAVWHGPSDVKLAEGLDDRAPFRRSCRFATHEPRPERISFMQFRKALLAHGFDAMLFVKVTGQLRAMAVRVKTDTLVEATMIASISKSDGETAWAGHRLRFACPRAAERAST